MNVCSGLRTKITSEAQWLFWMNNKSSVQYFFKLPFDTEDIWTSYSIMWESNRPSISNIDLVPSSLCSPWETGKMIWYSTMTALRCQSWSLVGVNIKFTLLTVLPLAIFSSRISIYKRAQQKQKTSYDAKTRERIFTPGDQIVMLKPQRRHKLEGAWEGPFKVRGGGPIHASPAHAVGYMFNFAQFMLNLNIWGWTQETKGPWRIS